MKKHIYEETHCFFKKDMFLWKDMLNEQYKRWEGKTFLIIGLHHIEDIQSEDWTRSKI